MQLTNKLLSKIAGGALVVTILIRVVTAFSIQDIYSCTTPDCAALGQADTKVSIGIVLQYVSLAVFAISIILLIYLWLSKKEKF